MEISYFEWIERKSENFYILMLTEVRKHSLLQLAGNEHSHRYKIQKIAIKTSGVEIIISK